MNTPLISRLTSIATAFTMTLVMLASINTLATSEPSAAQQAHATAMRHA